jgi:hypothetical protein
VEQGETGADSPEEKEELRKSGMTKRHRLSVTLDALVQKFYNFLFGYKLREK